MKLPPLVALALLSFCSVPLLRAAALPISAFDAAAAAHQVALVLPTYPHNADEVRTMSATKLHDADAALAGLVAQDATKLNFANSFAAYDAIVGNLAAFAGQIDTVAETNPDQATRDAARETKVKLDEWAIALEYREDVYRVLRTVAETNPELDAPARHTR